MIFALLGIMLLFSFGCPGEEVPAEPISGEDVPEETGANVSKEEPASEPIEEPTLPPEESPKKNESEEETGAEEVVPEEEPEGIVCVPVATDGYIELGVYEGDAKYYYEETQVAYMEKLELGKDLAVTDGARIALDEIILNGTCEECGAKPSWTYTQMAKLRITTPNGPELIVIAQIGQPGSFISSYKCKTLDWDGKTCIEYLPDESHQYYVWKVVANKTCVEEEKEIGGEEG